MRGGTGMMVMVAIMIAVFGVASIFGFMIFSTAEANADLTNQTEVTNATYKATNNIVMFGMEFMEILALLFVVVLVFIAAYMLLK